MIAISFSLHLLVVILMTLFNALTAEHIIIKPTGGDHHDCEADTTPCQTLSHYILNDPSIFNHSNTSLQFLPGAHNIGGSKEQHILIKGVHDISWYGDASERTEITCREGVAFVFADIRILSIRNLRFFRCGHYLPRVLSEHVKYSRRKEPKPYSNTSAALALANVVSLHLKRVVIQQSFGYGLLGLNVLGRSQILSCSFLENNEKCKLKSNTHYCVGGNAMLLFFDTLKLETVLPAATVLINNSHFYKGNDFSVKAIREWCSSDRGQADIPNRANGLGIIIEQQTYRIHISLEWVNFTRNIGNGKHPAVLFNDYSGVTNNITVTNCLFKNEGTFTLALADNDDCNSGEGETKFCYKDNPVEGPHISEVVTIRHSTFFNGISNGLLVCTKPNYQRENHYQRITIQGCVFTQYRQTHPFAHVSALKIIYDKNNKKGCPSINILVEGSSFINNYISSTSCLLLDYRQYIDSLESPCHQLLIHNCTYSESVSYVSTVSLNTGGRPNLLEYGNGSGHKGVAVDQVKISNTSFINNNCRGGRWTPRVILAVKHVYTIIDGCVFRNSIGTSVMARYTVIRMKGRNDFLNNSGTQGGGIALIYSIVLLMPNSTTNIVGNNANYGGGIYADPLLIPNSYSLTKTSVDKFNLCPFRFPVDNSEGDMNIKIKLIKNEARYAGDSIYGALYDKCYITNQCYGKSRAQLKCTFTEKNYKRHFSQFFQFEWRTTHEVSSDPNRLCVCSNSYITDQCEKKYVDTYPGETFNISLAAVGELNGTTNAVATATACEYFKGTCKPSNIDDLSRGPSKHALSAFRCKNLTYTVNSARSLIKIEVKIEVEFNNLHVPPFVIRVNILPCPAGFKQVNKRGKVVHCECLHYLTERNIQCNISLGKIRRTAEKWIGYHPLHPNNITAYDNCPFDYCISGEKYINLSVPDEQCNYNRSGVLCGACQSNLSLELGSSNCKQCSNLYLLLILPFSLAGLALVIILLKCNLTVSTGHINAIVFYANIVQVNKATLFPTRDTTYKVFSTFIAWLNLDFGIETCFYENMDAYGKVWLQFVFPVYLWLLIGLIVVLAYYSTRAARLIGNNSVPVLATLFILSYAKMLRTIIASVSFTYIEFQDGTYVPVWLQDGNMEYFSPKHIPLFTVAILFTITYIVPLTLLVLFAPCLQARSHYKLLNWVNRIKPFLDAYQGPYNDKYRFWTGLLLISRTILFVIFASNYNVDPAMNFFWITMLVGPIGMFVLVKTNHTVYRHGFANMLEIISLLNIIALSMISWLLTTTKYKKWSSGRKYATYISVGITGLLIVVLVIYQITPKFISKFFMRKNTHQNQDEPVIREMAITAPTHSIVEISQRESLTETLLDKQATDL